MTAGRPDSNGGPRVLNALTIDVEDYYHVSAFDGPGKRDRWGAFESRVSASTDRLLDVLDRVGVKATFFVLGWVAERHPDLVRRIARAGHELASHGFFHQLVYDLTPEAFRDDLRRAQDAISRACGVEVKGYRAPSFSITGRSLWALDVLAEEGYTFDSSIYPIRRDRYGMPGAPRFVHEIVRPAGRLIEVPPSTVRFAGATVPVLGGGYFRLYPFAWTERALLDLNGRERQPAVVYLHPWEVDPGQPRQSGSLLSTFRHYVNLSRTEDRLERLVRSHAFGRIADVLAPGAAAERVEAPSRGPRRSPAGFAAGATVRPC